MAPVAIALFEAFILALRQTPLDQHTEMTGRGALETLLNAFKPMKATVTHEPKRAQAKGAPDFKISQAGQVLGYVENKAVGENLDAVLKSDQIKKYQTLSGNIIVTDYLRWVWLKDGKVIADARLGEAGLLEDRKAQLRPERVADVEALVRNFFSQAPVGIARAKALAEALAVRSQLLRDFLGEELVRQQEANSGGQLFGLYGAFQKQVSHEITLAEFADAFAQTLAYGLFLAKLNDAANKEITLANAKEFIPHSVGLIRELVGFLDNLDRPEYADIAWVIEEVLSIINGLKLAEITEDLSFRNRKAKRGTRAGSDEEWRLFSRDPFIYFYEDYLAKYDSKLRKSRGVYYRARYADFLRTDFPRIPFPEHAKDFEALAALGWDLIQAHLMKAVPKRRLGAYRGKGDNFVGKPRYSPAERAVWINDTNHFTKLPPAVWDFTIGGYQVIDKYLKSRKGRALSLNEIENVENIINILDFSIEQMSKIDGSYEVAFTG